ncbi:MAG: hypothetical protein K5697_11590 [Lachnospiraceae bacterium]|nr:hypothetical protein [Lachnospiraceae bacterium]
MIRSTDRLFDRDGDGELNFHERLERDLFEQEMIRQMDGGTEEDEDEDDIFDDDIFDERDDDDLDGDADDFDSDFDSDGFGSGGGEDF